MNENEVSEPGLHVVPQRCEHSGTAVWKISSPHPFTFNSPKFAFSPSKKALNFFIARKLSICSSKSAEIQSKHLLFE